LKDWLKVRSFAVAAVESQLLAICPSGNSLGGKTLPSSGVFEHECDRWRLPTLGASIAGTPDYRRRTCG